MQRLGEPFWRVLRRAVIFHDQHLRLGGGHGGTSNELPSLDIMSSLSVNVKSVRPIGGATIESAAVSLL